MCQNRTLQQVTLLLISICLTSIGLMSFARPLLAQPFELAQLYSQRRRVTFTPPKGQSAPKMTLGGGRRDRGVCPRDVTPSKPLAAQKMRLLSPTNAIAVTIAAQPTLLVYVPDTKAAGIELTLFDETRQGIYQTVLPLTPPTKGGIVRFELTQGKVGLEAGKDYSWIVTLVCDRVGAQPEDPFVTGLIRRVQPERTLTQKLATRVNPLDRVALYAEAGIWYEAVAELDKLRRTKPNDSALTSAWNELLTSAGLAEGLTATTYN